MHNNDLVGSAREDAMDVEGDDRLSSLPDDVIHKILSFVSIKDAIGTSFLSSRWRSTWTSLPYLNFENLIHPPHLSKFISNALSHRNNQTQVSSINLVLDRTVKDDESVERILNYTFSHNAQQLSVTRPLPGTMVEYPYSFIATPTWDLPSLTTLHLHHVKLCNDGGLFSKCTNLKNLLLKRCKGTKVLNICHPQLSNLALEHTPMDMGSEEVVNVVAPQLKNLTIKWCKGKHLISAPGITSLVIEGFQPWQLSTPEGFHSLDKVELHMYDPYEADAHQIVCLLQQLHSVKLLTLNLGILECLLSQTKPLSSSHKACAFPNAKILKFITNGPVKVYMEVGVQEKVTTNYETSASAIFPMVSPKEIKAMSDMADAQVFVEHMRLLLDECKENTNNDKAHVDEHGKPEDEIYWAWYLQWNLGKLMARLKHRKIVALLDKCCMMGRISQDYNHRLEIHPIIQWLQEMRSLFDHTERLITEELSAPKRAVMLPIYLSLCKDGAILTENMLGWIEDHKVTSRAVAVPCRCWRVPMHRLNFRGDV